MPVPEQIPGDTSGTDPVLSSDKDGMSNFSCLGLAVASLGGAWRVWDGMLGGTYKDAFLMKLRMVSGIDRHLRK